MYEYDEKPKRGMGGSGRGILPILGIGCLAIIILFACGGLLLFLQINSLRGQQIEQEVGLRTEFNSVQASLDKHVTEIMERAGIGFIAGDEITNVLRDAVQGRYGENGFQSGSLLFASIQEAYPEDAAQGLTTIWSDISAAIADNRAQFKNDQDKLQARIQAYDNWAHGDLFREFMLNTFLGGIPSDNLTATVGTTVYKGQDAYVVISRIVSTSQTQDAFNTGTFEGVDPSQADPANK